MLNRAQSRRCQPPHRTNQTLERLQPRMARSLLPTERNNVLGSATVEITESYVPGNDKEARRRAHSTLRWYREPWLSRLSVWRVGRSNRGRYVIRALSFFYRKILTSF
jgi:hypothetical protein